MTLNVSVNGVWKEVGKDITWEEYQEYSRIQEQNHIDKVASKIGIGTFHFTVLDCERNEIGDTLILRFPTSQSLDDFVEENDFIHSVKVLDRSIGLAKVIVE